MQKTLGHIAVSASFDPTARTDGKLDYLREAERLRAADSEGRFTAFTFALNPDAAEDCAELCAGLRALGFRKLRGVIAGIELCDQSIAAESTAALVRCLELALANGIDKVFCVAEAWPAGSRQADFEGDIVPPFVSNVSSALRQVPGILEFGVEPLIPVEQQHVNTLARARHLAQLTNQALGEQRVYPVPDLAHLYGLVPRADWEDITQQLVEAVAQGEVRYAHLSMPETRTDQIVAAIEAGDVPMRAVQALAEVPQVDTESFDPQDRFLDALREMVPRFASADRSGWTDEMRFERFVAAARYFQSLG